MKQKIFTKMSKQNPCIYKTRIKINTKNSKNNSTSNSQVFGSVKDTKFETENVVQNSIMSKYEKTEFDS